MGNHCVDVICTECGNSWCARGCGDDSGPSKENLERWKSKKGEPIFLNCKIKETCSSCGSSKIAID